MNARAICCVAIVAFMYAPVLLGQTQDAASTGQQTAGVHRTIRNLFNYLNMAGTVKARDFQPMTQRERTQLYAKTMLNPLGYVKAGFSAGIDQWKDKPAEWQQGASGYGLRFANILGQYSIQRTVTFAVSSLADEDNRYFNSGKKGIWGRTGYAVVSGILARDHEGSRHLSLSQIGGVAAGAFISRLWQPPSQGSAAAAAVSFGITMASNMGCGVVKEFLPDIGHLSARMRKRSTGLPTAVRY
jgi:hypothetical protein